MKINPNLSGMGNVLGLINSANPGKDFTTAQVYVKSVTPRTPDSNPYNSTAVVSGTTDGPYKNDQVVFYNRRPITEAVESPVVSYQVDELTTLADLVQMVSRGLKIVSSEVELVGFKTEKDSSVSTMTLQPIANSLLYVDTFDIVLVWSGEEVQEAVQVLWAEDELNKLINVTMPSRGYL
jgi:hypothetical protein